MHGHFWFNSWSSLGGIAIDAVVAYVLFLGLVRTFGKRTISKRNPSDFAITVAFGSIIANWILPSPISLVDGAVALTIIVVLQWGTECLTTRWDRLRDLTEGSPTLLVYKGQMLNENMKHESINEHEILLSLRQKGVHRLEDVEAAVLEIDGTVSVVRRTDRPTEALRDVKKTVASPA